MQTAGPPARRERAAQLRSVRDHGRHGLPGARSRGRPGRDRGRRVCGHRPRAAGLPGRRAKRCNSGYTTTGSTSSAASCPCASASASTGTTTSTGLRHTLALFDAAQATNARPVLCDAGGPERIANPGRGGEDPGLRLTTAAGRRSSTASRAPPRSRATAGYEPVFHHHTSSYVEGLPEIERFLADTDIDLLLDSGHLAVAGGDPIQGLKDWRERVGVVHLKDTRMDVLDRDPQASART